MDKITYLAELAEGLARWVPKRERQDILRYYAEYFEEAGPDREAEVIAELGDPWALSCRLAVEGGYVTCEKAASRTPGKTWKRILLGTAVGMAVFLLVLSVGMLVTNVIRTVSNSGRLMLDYALGSGSVALAEDVNYADSCLIEGGSLETFNSIDADISLGSIQVLAGDDYTLSAWQNETLRACELTWEVRDGVLKLRYDGGNMLGADRQAVEVIITVPEGAALDNINVETGLGDVLVYGVDAKTVTVETGWGKVECYEARNVRKLRLNTGVGDVGLILKEAGPSLDIQLESGTGDVEVSLCGAEKDYSYTLESGTGAVTVNGVSRGREAKRGGSAPCKLWAESGTGNVSVYFT